MYTISVGARSSALSKAQVDEVAREISAFYPSLQLLPMWIETEGDRDKKTPLWQVNKPDFFTKEIDQRLLNGECRIALHSAKDLPSPLPEGLTCVALTQGLTPKDSLVMAPGYTLETLPPNPKIGSSSKRREAAIRSLRPDALVVDIRGTIDERLQLLEKRVVDAVVIAEAALIRLNLVQINRLILNHETEKLQGRLAIIARADDVEMKTVFSSISFP